MRLLRENLLLLHKGDGQLLPEPHLREQVVPEHTLGHEEREADRPAVLHLLRLVQDPAPRIALGQDHELPER